jgi:predicted transcriptional regulator
MTTYRTVSFRIPSGKVDELDALAKSMDRNRSYLLNEAIDGYLSYLRYYMAEVEEGIGAADRGELIDHEDVVKMSASWGERATGERQRKTA